MIPQEVPNLVAGEERSPAGGEWLEKTRPADGEPLCRLARSRIEDARHAVDIAVEAQPAWATRTVVERGNIVREIAERLRGRRDEAVELVTAETGNPTGLAQGEVDAAI